MHIPHYHHMLNFWCTKYPVVFLLFYTPFSFLLLGIFSHHSHSVMFYFVNLPLGVQFISSSVVTVFILPVVKLFPYFRRCVLGTLVIFLYVYPGISLRVYPEHVTSFMCITVILRPSVSRGFPSRVRRVNSCVCTTGL